MDTRFTAEPPAPSPAAPAALPYRLPWFFWLGLGFWLAGFTGWLLTLFLATPGLIGPYLAVMSLAGSLLEAAGGFSALFFGPFRPGRRD